MSARARLAFRALFLCAVCRVSAARAQAVPAPAVPASASARVELEVLPAGAQVIVDDRVVGRGSQPLSLAPGPHRVRVRATNYTVQEVSIELTAGESRALRVELRPFRSSPWPWIVLGGGAVGTAVVVAGVLATLPYAASFDRAVRVRFEGR